MRFSALLAAIFASLALVHAGPIPHSEIVQNTAKGLRLLSLSEGGEPVWKTDDQVLALMRKNVKFVRCKLQTVFTS